MTFWLHYMLSGTKPLLGICWARIQLRILHKWIPHMIVDQGCNTNTSKVLYKDLSWVELNNEKYHPLKKEKKISSLWSRKIVFEFLNFIVTVNYGRKMAIRHLSNHNFGIVNFWHTKLYWLQFGILIFSNPILEYSIFAISLNWHIWILITA